MRTTVTRTTATRTGGVGAWVARALVFVMLASTLGAVLAVRAPAEAAAAQNQPGTEVNVQLVLDSSGSMADLTNTGEPRIDAAKRVLGEVIDAIPDDREEINVGFRVFGHRGNNTESGKAESCASTDLTVPMEGVDKEALRAQVATYAPVGWTPIGLALERAGGDFPAAADTVRNAIILVTDGLETCDRDPCAIAAAINQSDASVTAYVVGLGLSEQELATTGCIAENTGGQIVGAQNAEELSAALFAFLEELQVVVTTGFLEIESIGGLWPRATITGEGSGATDSDPQGGQPFSLTLTDQTGNRVELNVGLYTVTWTNPSGQASSIRVNIEAERTTFIRGSLIKFPQGAGEIYVVKDLAGVIIWQDQLEQGDYVWVLPGIYRIDLLEMVGDPILISAEIQTLPGSAVQLEVFTAP